MRVKTGLHAPGSTFRERLYASEPAVTRVAKMFRREGYCVEQPEIQLKDADAGDLLVWLKGFEDRYVVEVKHRNLQFTSLETIDFSTIIVDRVAAFDEKAEKGLVPALYVHVNEPMTHVALQSVAKSRSDWFAAFDNHQNLNYYCPKHHLEVREI